MLGGASPDAWSTPVSDEWSDWSMPSAAHATTDSIDIKAKLRIMNVLLGDYVAADRYIPSALSALATLMPSASSRALERTGTPMEHNVLGVRWIPGDRRPQ